MKHLYDMFIERDVNFLEVNPLVLTADERLCATHAKVRIDHDAYYRQQELVMARDISQMHFKERISRENGLRYINLEGGSIGIIANGAGLAMASMDLLTLYGAKPANFMDLGGQAYHEKVTAALILMQKDEEVDAIFINTYSGIVPADKISVVIREAVLKGWVTKPIVCRLKGSFADGAN